MAIKSLFTFGRAIRLRQWTKNLLVFSAPLFTFKPEIELWKGSFIGFIAFCLISSGIYLLNDVLDIESDKLHPTKKFRPIAKGEISKQNAIILSATLIIISLWISLISSTLLTLVLLTYLFIQLAYCIRFKKEPILDILCISSGFLLRAIAGIASAELVFSPWFLLTVGLLALFLAIEKRKAELRTSNKYGLKTRKVLERYSLPLLLRLESLVSTSAFLSYSLWASGPTLNGAPTKWMLISVPFVLIGIFRYQLLSDPDESERRKEINPEISSEHPEEILLNDKGIKLTILGWLACVAVVGLGHHFQGLSH